VHKSVREELGPRLKHAGAKLTIGDPRATLSDRRASGSDACQAYMRRAPRTTHQSR
jgi:hypothetical protein